MATISLKHI